MKADCGILNPVQRDGTSQKQRLVRALHPSFVQVDERGIDELLAYAKKYAGLLRFYSPQNVEEGDWVAFIENDISTLISIIQLTSLDPIKQQFNEVSTSDPIDFRAYFPPFFELVQLADTWYRKSVEGLLLEKELRRMIQSLLNTSLKNVIGFALRLEQIGETGLTAYTQPSSLRADIWEISSLIADDLLFPSESLSNTDDLAAASRKMQREFQLFFDGLNTIIHQSDVFLTESLEQFPSHQPHMGLFLAFLKMFQLAQNHLNTLTRRHLNFYFRDVLQIDPLPARPDEVHMVFELAKSFDQHLLAEGTQLKGGKDANKENILFQTEEDLLVNKAQLTEVAPLKTVFIDKEEDGSGGYTINNIYAAPEADSLDGLGENILTEEGKWETLGSTAMPFANIGFAVSSPIFLMQEGERMLNLSLYFREEKAWTYDVGNDVVSEAAREIRGNVTPYFTGEKSWVKTRIERVDISREPVEDESMLRMEIHLLLQAGEAAFLAHNPEVHEGGLSTPHPALKFILDNEGITGYNGIQANNFLTTKSQATSSIPEAIQERILEFLNKAETWEDVTARKSEIGPIIDNPSAGADVGNEIRGYEIGEGVAKNILNERTARGGTFASISDILDIDGLGVDEINDLYYTFSIDPVTDIKEKAKLYGEEVSIQSGEYVLHKGYYYQAQVDAPFGTPSESSPNWQQVSRSYPYKYFQGLALQHIEIEIEVQGVKSLLLENDIGLLNPAKPFMPFGPQPKKGSKFFIGSPEVFLKSLTGTSRPEIELSLNWADLPEEGFGNHYAEYNSVDATSPFNNNYFTVSFQKLEGGEWQGVGSSDSLFENGTNEPQPEKHITLENVLPERALNLEEFSQLSTQLGRGFIRMELENDFFHGNYAPSITTYVDDSTGYDHAPNQPYTPTLNSISLTYRSREVISFSETPFEERVEKLFHIEPFGWKEIYPFDRNVDKKVAVVSSSIVPEFLVANGADTGGTTTYTDAEGSLYIGLADSLPPQSVSILFQLAEGSADPELPQQEVVWSYLIHNEWFDFKTAEILSDTTNGLLTSGIISFALPREVNDMHTSLASSTFWIKASVANHTAAISKAIAIMPQAVKATFDLKEENDSNRLTVPLAAESIGKLQERQAAIKKVLQPFASFNGKIAEQVEAPAAVTGDDIFRKEYNEYYVRLSERLRHKNRGITIYDYERIILQVFPDIYKVKCLNHTRIKTDSYDASEHAPGHVKLIVLPNLQNRNAVDPMRPRVSLNTLTEIRDHIQPLISDFIQLEVKNPDFEEVRVHFKVKFHPAQDANRGFYETLLIQSIRQFLAPWIYEEGEDLSLGGKIHRSLILNHLEEQDYVDFVTDFHMDHIISETEVKIDVEEAVASTSSSVLVSADTHIITFDIDEKCLTP
ncbi:MAG: hypothetical protein AAF655_08855 [Bacteroidota bacterium]